MATILIIDDEPGIRGLLKALLHEDGHTFLEAGAGPEGVALYDARRPDMVFCDVVLPELDGIAVLKRIKALNPMVPVVVMTADSSTELAIRAMSLGASDYLVKPFGAKRTARMVRETLKSLRPEEPSVSVPVIDPHDTQPLLGNTDEMYEVFKLIGRVASQSLTVLVLGESGTGKELVARAIHSHSPQRDGPFIAVNCAAIPESLLESELFGHEKGAFTGADRQRTGKFELAGNGTLFLDEIGDMSLAVQAKLLRVIQDQEFYRLGGSQTVRTTARILAATNHDLREEAGTGRFREDLFYRLSGVVIRLPALRDRRDDIPMLAEHFLRKSAHDLKRSVRSMMPGALEILRKYHWPGNIRELANVVQQAVLQATGPTIIPAQFESLVSDPRPKEARVAPTPFDPVALREEVLQRIASNDQNVLTPLMNAYEQAIIGAVLDHCQGNMSSAAKHLGIHRVTLKSKLPAARQLAGELTTEE
ncbi:sigma-54-dependent transcriptional regulator [Zavarzinella formosa]|uniref:sigma-54-dependent transcriptional regulator n=1 Tax=Zavarzinella formosa TaxID=360055 RepID=UPI0002D5BEC9|nr:sigma-54 dependent transcriptional regulator [Zavarzinella formosa]